MMAAIAAARRGKKVLLLEKLSQPGAKLKATGGGRCNLTNTHDNETFMARFGKEGRFMTPALEAFDQNALREFFAHIGVVTDAPDGFRVFPVGHSSLSVLNALENEMARLGVTVRCKERAEVLEEEGACVTGVATATARYKAPYVIIATGGLGYPKLGAEGDGFRMVRAVGHSVTDLHPAMMPLRTRECWVAECRADTIPGVTLRVDQKKASKLRATGDLIFTQHGIRGPVVLDFAREITPLLEKYGEVPLLLNMTKGMHEDAILRHISQHAAKLPDADTLTLVKTLLPESVARQLILAAGGDPAARFGRIPGVVRDRLIKTLAWTPLTVIGHEGFAMAMITRGGVPLKEIDPKTMQSRVLKGLYFCGEVTDLDGPCGGYNLQWSFSSGFLAGSSAAGCSIA
jgi:hypothetical protein